MPPDLHYPLLSISPAIIIGSVFDFDNAVSICSVVRWAHVPCVMLYICRLGANDRFRCVSFFYYSRLADNKPHQHIPGSAKRNSINMSQRLLAVLRLVGAHVVKYIPCVFDRMGRRGPPALEKLFG